MPKEVVYVLGTPGSNTVKIGRTTNLAKRVADIQRMSPVPLAVLWQTPGGHELETALHRHFACLRSHGEWFAFRLNAVQLIRWAVEDEPWDRPKVDLEKVAPRPNLSRKSIPAPRLSSADQQRWRDDLDGASKDHMAARTELEALIAACRRAGISLTLISEHTPFSREWVRRIADRVDKERVA